MEKEKLTIGEKTVGAVFAVVKVVGFVTLLVVIVCLTFNAMHRFLGIDAWGCDENPNACHDRPLQWWDDYEDVK